jgi:hypothetical protein
MTNPEHMPHPPTPTYTDRECQQQSVSYNLAVKVSVETIHLGGFRHRANMALSRGGIPDLMRQE